MEAVGVALIVFGPLAAVLLLLIKAIRKLRPRPVVIRRWGGPARGGGLVGDREPRRPLTPSASGAACLPLPVADDVRDEPESPVRVIPRPPDGAPGYRAAG